MCVCVFGGVGYCGTVLTKPEGTCVCCVVVVVCVCLWEGVIVRVMSHISHTHRRCKGAMCVVLAGDWTHHDHECAPYACLVLVIWFLACGDSSDDTFT